LETFDGPARAVRRAQSIVGSVPPLGIAIRASLHTGEIEVRDEYVAGIAVNIASRISHLAESEEILVSSKVKDLVAGCGLAFDDLRSHKRLNGTTEFMPEELVRPCASKAASSAHHQKSATAPISALRPFLSFVAPARFSKADIRRRGPSTIMGRQRPFVFAD
jgi:hypothetical protein